MSKYYLELPLSLERVIGADGKFLFAKFGAYGETKKECETEVREWIAEFCKEAKAKKNKPPTDLPFETPTEVNGVRLLKNKPLTKIEYAQRT